MLWMKNKQFLDIVNLVVTGVFRGDYFGCHCYFWSCLCKLKHCPPQSWTYLLPMSICLTPANAMVFCTVCQGYLQQPGGCFHRHNLQFYSPGTRYPRLFQNCYRHGWKQCLHSNWQTHSMPWKALLQMMIAYLYAEWLWHHLPWSFTVELYRGA